jgi:ABC-2 type transport system permease protein
MKRVITGIVDVFKRELNLMLHDRNIKSIIILAPIFYSLFYASVYFNKTERDVPVVVVNMDKSTMSDRLIKNIDANQFIRVVGEVQDYPTAQDLIYKEKVQAVIVIPHGFESSIKSFRGTTVKLLINTSRFLVSNDINMAVNEVVYDFNNDLKIKSFEHSGYSYNQAVIVAEPLKDEVKFLFNSSETYGDFLIPGMLILILQQTLLMGISESVSKENEKRTITDWFIRGKSNTLAAVSGKGIFYFLLFSGYAFMFYSLHFRIFSINQKGSYILLILMTALFLTSVITIGMFAASFIKTKLLSLQIMALTSYPIFFLSGYSWPLKGMPIVLQSLAQLIPFTPFVNAFIRITQMGAGLYDVIPQIIHLIILCIIGYSALHLRMRKLYLSRTE